jgi:putative ABC transport system ATP-binding protein
VDALELAQVWKSYPQAAGEELHALRGVSLRVPAGRVVAITGRSGSGKSTLLHLAAGIDAPTRGAVRVLGRELGQLGDRERSLRRREEIGLVFQFFHLLAHLDVRENVALPALIAGRRDLGSRVDELLARVGLADRADAPVGQLSGGEMQRVAICRALLRRPRLLLADEPTGNLDDETGRAVMALLLELVAEHDSALVYVTHSKEMAALAHEHWSIRSGVLERP